ncbi:MAG: hypothetical protein HZA50_06690 [Planctomycetes bacterium]|nr:hypothetical protein [Planctomycetota bacterium]
MRYILHIPILLAVALSGCPSSDSAKPTTIPVAVFMPPTAKHPIVLDVGHPKSYLVFGGKDGTKQIRIMWPEGVIKVATGRQGKMAAAYVSPPGKKPFVVFYDSEGQEISRVELQREPGRHEASLWVGDRGEALLHIAAFEPRSELGKAINPQMLYLSKDGTVKLLDFDAPYDVFFPDVPIYAVIVDIPKIGHELRRYSKPGELIWKKQFMKNQGRPFFLFEPENGSDLTIYLSGKKFSFSKDGKELKE